MAWVKPPNRKITDHFHFTTEAACRHCGKVPSVAVIEETAEWLEVVREVLGDRPMHVTSWSRCPAHNEAVGGATHSLHMQGIAVDFTVRGLSPREVQKILRGHQGKGRLIGGLGSYPSWTHVDRGPARRWNGP